jgi:hypothetical protein
MAAVRKSHVVLCLMSIEKKEFLQLRVYTNMATMRNFEII